MEIDIDQIDLTWTASQLEDYMKGRYCLHEILFNKDSIPYDYRYTPVFYKGISGSLAVSDIGEKNANITFISPARLKVFLSYPMDTSECVPHSSLPTTKDFNRVDNFFSSKYKGNNLPQDPKKISNRSYGDQYRRIIIQYTPDLSTSGSKLGVVIMKKANTPSEH